MAFLTDLIDPSVFAAICPEKAAKDGFWGAAHNVGTLCVAALADDGTVTVRTVASLVKHYEFSTDSSMLAVAANFSPCTVDSSLMLAAADGAGAQALDAGPISTVEVHGNSLFYSASDSSGTTSYHVQPIGGGPNQTVSFGFAGWVWSHDGSHLAYLDPSGNLVVADVAGGHLSTGGPAATLLSWSNDDRLLQYIDSDTSQLTIVSNSAKVVETLPTSGLMNRSVFAPDSSHILYDAPDGNGGIEFRVHSIGSGSDVHIQGLPDPSSFISLEFTGDGAAILFTTAAPDYSRTLWYASTTASGQARQISYSLNQTYFDSPASGGYVAVDQAVPPDFVFSLDGATSTTVPHGAPNYEPGTGHPRLLITPFDQTVTSLSLASTDGSNAVTIQLPVTPGALTWLGHNVLLSSVGTRAADPLSDYYALDSKGSAWVALAAAAENLVHAPIPFPTRAFYSRRASNAAGPAGLWMVPLP